MNLIKISLSFVKKSLAEREVFPIRGKMFYLQFSYGEIPRVGVTFKIEFYILRIFNKLYLPLICLKCNVYFMSFLRVIK